jgi:uroporphyrin-III C-methyltransferase/precorrin-2 dehydrogenase/sirohydrochlorin ferrochelatase
MESLPIFMRIAHCRCLVIGGGDVALRKVTMLMKAEASIEVVAPEVCSELLALEAEQQIKITCAEFSPAQIDGAVLVIAATDDELVNTRVSVEAKARNIPVNVVDSPALCTFTMPAIIDRSPLVIAISSNGSAPVLARLIRAKIETMVPATYGRLASLAREFRDDVKAKFTTTQNRRVFWEK